MNHLDAANNFTAARHRVDRLLPVSIRGEQLCIVNRNTRGESPRLIGGEGVEGPPDRVDDLEAEMDLSRGALADIRKINQFR